PARLVEAVWRACPPDVAGLEAAARTVLGLPPDTREVARIVPAGAERVDGTVEPLASWLRVWDWSPVLPAAVLAGWEPLLAALRRIQPDGPADPRVGARLEPVKARTDLDVQDLLELAAARGPLAAAGALATAEDAGADGYAIVLYHLVEADPAAWTADVPAVLQTLRLPVLRAFYLGAAEARAYRPGRSGENLPQAITAALQLRRALAQDPPANAADENVQYDVDRALFGLLTDAWRTGTDLGDVLPEALAHLHALAAPLTRPAPAADASRADDERPKAGRLLPDADPAVRALECLLDYAAHRARTVGEMPQDVLDLVAGALAVFEDQEAVATAIGPRLPELHHHAPGFTAAHRAKLYTLPPGGRPSPAAAWLRGGPTDPPLLACLDRAGLLAAPREGDSGPSQHLSHGLTADPHLIGDPATVFAGIAAGPGGPGAVSCLLQLLATRLIPRELAESLSADLLATQPATKAVPVLWRAALAAGLPPGALAGAGAFARRAVDDAVWLPLTLASAEHTPALTDAATVAERAAGHSDSRDALLLTARLVACPTQVWAQEAVLRHARTLLQAAAARPSHEHPHAVEELRQALINAGEVDAAQA
ncbi:hypothetical protein ACWD4N_42990, partial [Streptomyces sp. NPDC002586]